MRLLQLLIGVAVLPMAILGLAGADDKKEPDFKGAWTVVAVETPDGQKVPDEVIKNSRIEFTADKMILKDGDRTKEATYKSDPSKTPKTIDFVPADGPEKGKTLLGIYQFENDGAALRLCISGADNDRPKDFFTYEKTKTGVLTLKRVKP